MASIRAGTYGTIGTVRGLGSPAKCIVFMWYLKDNKNRPYANELIAAVESPCANGGLLTFVLDCIRSASPGSTEIFASGGVQRLCYDTVATFI